MTVVAAASSLLMAAVAMVLLLRLRAAGRDGRARLEAAVAPDDFSARVFHLVQSSIDKSLLANAGAKGLADVEVRSREQCDSYRSVAELLDWLARESAGQGYAEVSGLIKGIYQLGQALRAPESAVIDCLQPLFTRLKTSNSGSKAVGRVECIQAGTILDPETMAPLNYGGRVTQPLGVLLYDSEGKLLGKAKVLCG